jgi:RNA polymerase sigma-70 factor, ECF subfamily
MASGAFQVHRAFTRRPAVDGRRGADGARRRRGRRRVRGRICGDGPGAEDSCQDAFLAIWRSAGRYDARVGSVRSWLLTVVHHRAIDRVRRVTRHRTQIGGGDDVAALVPAADDTEHGALERVDRAEMVGLVAALPEEQRQAISLSFYSGYSNSEIGRILGIPLGTVKSRMRRGLERLRQSLEVAT